LPIRLRDLPQGKIVVPTEANRLIGISASQRKKIPAFAPGPRSRRELVDQET